MASCSGCGVALGFKKYKFKKIWRIGGQYCRPCMVKIGADWDEHGRVTLPMFPCDLCKTEFYFLKTAWQGSKEKHFCDVCHNVAISGVLPDKEKEKGGAPGKMPIPMMIFAGLGVLMMVLGMIFTLTGTSAGEMNLVNLLFGAFTTAAGFMLIRRTLKNRRLLVGQ